jgi:hypothetical protein
MIMDHVNHVNHVCKIIIKNHVNHVKNHVNHVKNAQCYQLAISPIWELSPKKRKKQLC